MMMLLAPEEEDGSACRGPSSSSLVPHDRGARGSARSLLNMQTGLELAVRVRWAVAECAGCRVRNGVDVRDAVGIVGVLVAVDARPRRRRRRRISGKRCERSRKKWQDAIVNVRVSLEVRMSMGGPEVQSMDDTVEAVAHEPYSIRPVSR